MSALALAVQLVLALAILQVGWWLWQDDDRIVRALARLVQGAPPAAESCSPVQPPDAGTTAPSDSTGASPASCADLPFGETAAGELQRELAEVSE